jgi:outer membrane protein OmpA-like peptidoglycan-associated protein
MKCNTRNDQPYVMMGIIVLCGLLLWGCGQKAVVKTPPNHQIKTIQTDRGLLLILESVYFAFNSVQLTDSALSIIEQIVEIIGEYPNSHIAIDGYTDDRGTTSYNLRLSTARAESVKSALVAQGIPADRLTAQGFAASNPIADNRTAEGRQRNRRVEILILKPIDIPSKTDVSVLSQ